MIEGQVEEAGRILRVGGEGALLVFDGSAVRLAVAAGEGSPGGPRGGHAQGQDAPLPRLLPLSPLARRPGRGEAVRHFGGKENCQKDKNFFFKVAYLCGKGCSGKLMLTKIIKSKSGVPLE